MSVVSMNLLLEAGVHFGHQTRRWNPKMARYIYTDRNGIYIIDLQKTAKKIEEAYKVLNKIAQNNGKVIFVGTKKQAQEAVMEEAIRSNSFYVNQRWLGGTLTNFKTIRRRIKRMEEIEKMEKDGIFAVLPKKEVIELRKEHERLVRFLGGIRDMVELPDAMFVIDPRKERNAILEARKLNIPVFGIVDTNCDPDDVDYVIPANDDAIRAVKLIVGVMANAVVEAQGGKVVDFGGKNNGEGEERPERRRDDRRDNNRRDNNRGERRYDNNRGERKFDGNRDNNRGERKFDNNRGERKFDGNRDNNRRDFNKPTTTSTPEPVVETIVETKKVETAKVDFEAMTLADLKDLAKDKGIKGFSKMKKSELIDALK